MTSADKLIIIGSALHFRGEHQMSNAVFKEAGVRQAVGNMFEWLRERIEKIPASLRDIIWGQLMPGQFMTTMLVSKEFIKSALRGFGSMFTNPLSTPANLLRSFWSLLRTVFSASAAWDIGSIMTVAFATDIAILLGSIAGAAAAVYIVYRIIKALAPRAARLFKRIVNRIKKKGDDPENVVREELGKAKANDVKAIVAGIGLAAISSAS